MENPFDNPTTIRTPESFIGRDDELYRIFGLLQRRQNASLIGPKRIGKTSLLTSLRNEDTQKRFGFAGADFCFFYLDLQQRSMKTPGDLFDDLNRVLKKQSQGYRAEDWFGKDDEFAALLDGFQQRGLHPVLIIDTFDEIARYEELDANIFNVLRSQANGGHISYITASLEPLGKIFSKLRIVDAKVSPFYNIFCNIWLQPFSRDEAAFLLSNFSQREGLPFTEQEIKWVLEMAGYHPYLLQQVAAVLFEKKRTHGAEAMNFSLVRKEALQNLYSHFEDCCYTLNVTAREELLAEIQQEDGGEHSYPELCSSRLFQEYLQRTSELEQETDKLEQETGELEVECDLDLTAKKFTKILDKFGDTRLLGESALINMPYIAAQINQQHAVLPVVRGKIVQQTIMEALTSISGQEKRSDHAPDWLDYNILYYITKHHMTRKMISGRLGISERHLYRFISRAAERLLGVMLTMEESRESDSVV